MVHQQVTRLKDFGVYHRLEKYFKEQLHTLLERNEYNPRNINQRHALAYVFLPKIQRECDAFVDLWNSHRIRSQNNLELTNGIPHQMFSFLEQYGGTQNIIPVTTQFLQELSTQSALSIDNRSIVYDFMDEEFLKNCEHFPSDPIEIPSNEAIDAYRFLKYKLRI